MPKRNTDLERGELFLNRYQIIAPVAGRVQSVLFYKVLDLCYGSYRTLKLLSDSPKYAERALARLKAGLQLLRGCKHENLETVFEFGHSPQGIFYIVSECVEGQPLSERCDRQQPFSPEEARSILAAACSGLAEAHRRSVSFHVSPRNVLCSDARVMLVDFGLQTWFADTVRELCLFDWWYDDLLRPEYHPPVARGDAGDDLYSLGVVLFEMLTGDLPFPSTSRRGNPARLTPSIPAGLAAVFRRAVTQDDAARYVSAQAMRADLTAATAPAADAGALNSALSDANSAASFEMGLEAMMRLAAFGFSAEGSPWAVGQIWSEDGEADLLLCKERLAIRRGWRLVSLSAHADRLALQHTYTRALELWRAPGPSRILRWTADADISGEFSPDGTRFAYVCGNVLSILDEGGNACRYALRSFREEFTHLAWSQDARCVIAADSRGALHVLDENGGRPVATFNISTAITGIAVSHDGSSFAVAADGRVHVCDRSGSILSTLTVRSLKVELLDRPLVMPMPGMRFRSSPASRPCNGMLLISAVFSVALTSALSVGATAADSATTST